MWVEIQFKLNDYYLNPHEKAKPFLVRAILIYEGWKFTLPLRGRIRTFIANFAGKYSD